MAKRPSLVPVVPGEPVESDVVAGDVSVESDEPDVVDLDPVAEAEAIAALPETELEMPAQPVKAAGELPDVSEIDPKAITRSVLTKQGIVVPDLTGR